MRKGIAVILALIIMMSLSACTRGVKYIPQENLNFNYNNITADNSYFWLTNKEGYYSEAPFMTINYYSITNQGRRKITSASNGASAKVQAYDDQLLMLDFHNEDLYRLHSYDLDTGTHKILGYVENVHTFFKLYDRIFYLQEDYSGDELCQALYVCDLDGDTKKLILEDVFAAGVSNGKLVYLKRNQNEFAVYHYEDADGESRLLGRFACQVDEEKEYIESGVNFTTNQVILTVSGQTQSRLVCFDLRNGQVFEHMVEGLIWSAIAYENYAFLIVLENPQLDTDEWVNLIVRVNLQDGAMDTISEIHGGLTDSFVASDDCVYVSNSLEGGIYRIDADGSKSLVCTF
jgi:hypothetical protein